jgi:hypothetical protein
MKGRRVRDRLSYYLFLKKYSEDLFIGFDIFTAHRMWKSKQYIDNTVYKTMD